MNGMLKLNNRDRETLVASSLLSKLSVATLARMLDIATIGCHGPREVLFAEGDTADSIYCVLSGYVRLYKLGRDGREADIALYGPGDTVGITALSAQDPHQAHAEVSERATLVRFDLRSLTELAATAPDLSLALIATLARDLRAALECSANDRLYTAPQRVAHYLEQNCANAGAPASFRLPYQKCLLAGKLGLAPEALSRAFSTLRDVGVSVHGRIIRIENAEALRNI